MYTVKQSIIKNGQIFDEGAEIELTADEAKYLGDKVEKQGARKTNKDEEGSK